MTRTASVLTHVGWDGNHAVFQQVPDEPSVNPSKVVRLDMPTFRDLGSPAEITVTVEPGDRLNT